MPKLFFWREKKGKAESFGLFSVVEGFRLHFSFAFTFCIFDLKYEIFLVFKVSSFQLKFNKHTHRKKKLPTTKTDTIVKVLGFVFVECFVEWDFAAMQKKVSFQM